MATVNPEQLAAAVSILRQYIDDPEVSPAVVFLQALEAFKNAGPGRKKPISDDDLPEGFDAFWAAYPRQIAKRTAIRSYIAALTRTSSQIILGGANRYAADCKSRAVEQQYIKHPSTWLNSDGWADKLGELSLVGSGGPQRAAQPGVSLGEWVKRLEMYAGVDGYKRFTWLPNSWGPIPKEPGCLVPEEAYTEFRRIHPIRQKGA